MGIVIKWFINALALFIVARIVPGIEIKDFGTAMVAIIIIGLINVLVKPVLLLLTLPINILTLGLFTFILNALMLMLAASFTPDFRVAGLGAALVGSILLTIISTILSSLVS